MLDYIWLVPTFPLVGVILNGLLGSKLPRKMVGLIACGALGLSFLLSITSFFSLLKLPPEHRVLEKIIYTWISSGTFRAEVGFQLDPLSAVMILVVSGVGFLIHIYSIGYMHGDRGYARYFTYLNLFASFMLILVLANNFLLMFVGWEGVGLCSYLLIGFWYERKSAADAGKKAFIVNRIGDFGFILGIMLIFSTFGTVDFTEVFQLAPEKFTVGAFTITAITLLLFVGATGKSAQLPLYTWLPDAMEGPTPVSALIHAATMVTAGVYMVARCHALFLLAPISLTIVAIIGAVTAIFAASIGLVQNDIKRVLAYSTISQLGYMFLGCGVGAFSAGIFHLMTHAFFKALLFMGAGSVIHALGGEQDLQKMGGLRRYMPITFPTFLVATLAIAGVPGFSGFFSKDEILWEAFQSHFVYWLIGVIAAGMTSFYMFRLVFMAFFGPSRVEAEKAHHLHESPPSITLPLTILAFLSFVGGYVGVPQILGGSNRFHAFLSPVFGVHNGHGGEASIIDPSRGTEFMVMAVSVLLAAGGFFLAYYMYIKRPDLPETLSERFRSLYQLVFNKYYVDEIYDCLFVNPIKRGANQLWQMFDIRVVDGSVNGVANLAIQGSGLFSHLQSGYVKSYALSILIGMTLIIGYYILW
jgi:NADH-quinone oxidoreductase subunit L